jgi:hypothetical protein
MEQTAVQEMINIVQMDMNNGVEISMHVFMGMLEKAREKEKQQKIAYKISTPLGHVAHCIEKYGIENAIEDYKCKLVNNKESKFWNDCLKIAEYYKETFKQQEQ